MVGRTGCEAQEAREYLLAEEGLVEEAVVSFVGDRDFVKISIKYEGSSFIDSKWVARGVLSLYEVGSTWASGDGSTRFVVVSH